MTIIDPVGDMLTRIRNAIKSGKENVECPYSKLKVDILKLLKSEGFIKYYEIVDEDLKKRHLKIGIKYTADGESVISAIKKVSLSSKRKYVKKKQVPKVRNGFGISILTTPKGVLTGRQARINNTGGELLAVVY